MRELGRMKSWSEAARIKEYLADEGINVKIELEGEEWTLWVLDDDQNEVAEAMFQAAAQRIKKSKWKRILRPDLALSSFFKKTKSFFTHRWVLVLGGLGLLFLCIGYYPDLLSFWPWGGKSFVALVEFPLEGLAIILILIGSLAREEESRVWWTGKSLIMSAMLTLVLFGYNHLKWDGRLAEWEERRPDTKIFKETFAKAVNSIKHTSGGLTHSGTNHSFLPPKDGKHVATKDGIIIGGGVEGGRPIVLYDKEYADNPSMDKLKKFLLSDKTDKIEYVMGKFVCADFAERLHNQAEEKGIKCAYVTIELGPTSERQRQEGHALVAFNPTDYEGLVFIDCTGVKGDATSTVKHWDRVSYKIIKGQTYRPKLLFPKNKFFSENVEGMGKILEEPIIQW
tara:strand:+ start:404 stop:1591 length:1188 start_codon:yes stop_codon:yes gene_type:complete